MQVTILKCRPSFGPYKFEHPKNGALKYSGAVLLWRVGGTRVVQFGRAGVRMSSSIPVIDIHSVNINISDDDIKADELDRVAAKIVDAFSTIGFVYLKNHGISQQLVSDMYGFVCVYVI